MFDRLLEWVSQLIEWFSRIWKKLAHIYHPRTWKEKGLVWSVALFIVTYLIITSGLGWYWSMEPARFDIRQAAYNRVGHSDRLVTGSVYTSSLIEIGTTLLEKPGGYVSNDIAPPGLWMDNMPNWEFGALVMLRDAVGALRDHFSRSQSQSVEDVALAEAEPQLNFQNNSWILPATEREYRTGIKALEDYLSRLADTDQQAQFYARADNLRLYLDIVEKRLGSLSQRLSASVGQLRVNTDLANDPDARQATTTSGQIEVKTPWRELDDVFYEARGASWALLHILRSIEMDFASILEKKNALVSLRQIIRELEATQTPTFSPVILNGSGFGIFSNYSLTMANYISRANAAVIDLRDLLQRG